MKERPVIFNGEMIRALLDGRKTQTRRVVSDKHLHLIDVASQVGECYPLESGIDHANSQSYYREHCPFGQVGDRLWVRETWQGPLVDEEHFEDYRANADKFQTPEFCEYAADGCARPEFCDLDDNVRQGWRPSIHMPRWASRILLEITAVRVERLKDISQYDAIAEGGPPSHPSIDAVSRDYGFPDFSRSWFAQTWQHIYGAENWNANPWVWVIEFKRVEVRDGK